MTGPSLSYCKHCFGLVLCLCDDVEMCALCSNRKVQITGGF